MRIKELSIPNIGKIILEQKPGQKSLRLRINSSKGLTVSAAPNVSEAEIINFVIRNTDWIKSKEKHLKEKKQEGLFNYDSVFITNSYELCFHTFNGGGARSHIDTDKINVYIGSNVDITNHDFQKFIQKTISNALKIEAHLVLPKMLDDLANHCKFVYNGLSIGNASRSWGSCKIDNSIILSCRLMLLPDYLKKYIMLHELCHTVHKNHSKDFHALLDYVSGGKSKALNNDLKKHSIAIKPGIYKYQ
jgi:predicted metal-dependent hydrolase